ncbi:MAG TPA: DUF547 domain-containing protein, partial [Candidatus Krumholzibacteria bacterium]|nr:DUF547 domain-containing protein [Candidatus Krumholzibacteria bacterium]
WDFNKVNVMGHSITLGYIEAKILRRDFHDPRVHLALVPAAAAAPMLRNEPYEGTKLDAQLDDQARKFLASPRNFRIDRAKKEVRVSEIFRWYADDFAVQKFAGPYVNDADRAFLSGARVTYLPYDWTLNEQRQ